MGGVDSRADSRVDSRATTASTASLKLRDNLDAEGDVAAAVLDAVVDAEEGLVAAAAALRFLRGLDRSNARSGARLGLARDGEEEWSREEEEEEPNWTNEKLTVATLKMRQSFFH